MITAEEARELTKQTKGHSPSVVRSLEEAYIVIQDAAMKGKDVVTLRGLMDEEKETLRKHGFTVTGYAGVEYVHVEWR